MSSIYELNIPASFSNVVMKRAREIEKKIQPQTVREAKTESEKRERRNRHRRQ
jgi:hypothetical protein